LNSKFQQQEVLVYRGVRHRSELNKWVTEIRPTAHKRKIWLGTYKSPEEAARVYDVQIHYTGKKIPLNFPEFVKNLPELPQGLSWEELAPFVKKQALTAAKRARVEGTTTTTSKLPQTTTTKLFPKAITIRGQVHYPRLALPLQPDHSLLCYFAATPNFSRSITLPLPHPKSSSSCLSCRSSVYFA
jgi:hypothetical protein